MTDLNKDNNAQQDKTEQEQAMVDRKNKIIEMTQRACDKNDSALKKLSKN